ncbi:hypothetical protein ACFE04_011572 [Oxalis oulophora]
MAGVIEPPQPPPTAAETPIKHPEPPSSATATKTQQPKPPSSDTDSVHIPSYSGWFSWNNIHECETRFLPEFFDERSPSKTPNVYKYYRDSIIKRYRQNPLNKLTFTDVRRCLVGDVGSVRRVFDFLDAWGLINYSPSAINNKTHKWEDGKSLTPASSVGDSSVESESLKKVCSSCKSFCTIACFACDKHNLILCARCYVRGNHSIGVNSSDFRRVELVEVTKAEWTEKETLQLLEAVMHFGDDWKKVARHVAGRNEKDCVAQFIKLPFGEEYLIHPDKRSDGSPNKRTRASPLLDSGNPIMAQASFLTALSGVEIAEASARAAVAALSEVGYGVNRGRNAVTESNGNTTVNELELALVDASSELEKDELDVERGVQKIVEQMIKIRDKIADFEELDLQMEKDRQQFEQMKSQLFADQLTLMFRKNHARNKESVKTNVL